MKPNTIDIGRWVPQRREEFIPGTAPIEFFDGLTRRVRSALLHGTRDFHYQSALVVGPSRSGKTASANYFMRQLQCEDYDNEAHRACFGTCTPCREHREYRGDSSILCVGRAGNLGHQEVLYTVSVDCSRMRTPAELEDTLRNIEDLPGGIGVFYFDEVHRLTSRGMDEMLLIVMERVPGFWIFSTARPDELDQMLVNRTNVLQTKLPSVKDLSVWLGSRCLDWAIPFENKAVILLAEKSGRSPGVAKNALQMARSYDGGLSVKFVETIWNAPTATVD